MTNFTALRAEPGVLTAPGQEPRYTSALLVDESETEIRIVGPDGDEVVKVSRIDHDGSSARLVLSTKKSKYNWRPIREADGIWISKLGIPLPVEVIPSIATGETVTTEVLSAFSSGDSPYVLGVVYETAEGSWVRQGGQFLPMASDDTTYADMDRIEIEAGKSKEFLDLYDRNYVTVSDAAGFEALGE